MGKAERKQRPQPPRWWNLDNDNCWFCKNRNNCNQCKLLKEFKRKKGIELAKQGYDEVEYMNIVEGEL